ncbi:MAG TPA: glycosyltransferase family 39 protein, partial [Gemmataceae bacterium]|nr:glycosyltransferase family 39 protein [Gemmataceae bacterium]
MSTAIPTPAPAVQVRWPLAWLLAILAAGLVLRVLHFKDEAFQLDEFTALAAVAERPGVEVGTTPTADDPLVPVGSLAEVSNRSVIPFGVRDPGPLYHAILWRVCQVLPVADWSLRLPSLLAGLACVAAVFFLIRRPFGDEMALVAALFVALDPIQVATSWLARPYALANLFVVLSFAALRGLLRTSEPRTAALLAVGYGACVAVIGYLNGLLLFVVAAHVGMVLYAVRGGAGGTARQAAGYWAGGLVFAAILLAPESAYLYQVSAFALDHRDYLTAVNEIHLFTPLKALVEHNLVF